MATLVNEFWDAVQARCAMDVSDEMFGAPSADRDYVIDIIP